MLKEPQRNLPVTSTAASGEGVELVSDGSSLTISLKAIHYQMVLAIKLKHFITISAAASYL